MSMKISLNSVLVKDQGHALDFYTNTLGFIKKTDIDLGEFRWLTVVSKEDPNGTELVLEPNAHPASKVYQNALYTDGIPLTSFAVDDTELEYKRLAALQVNFKMQANDVGDSIIAIFDDTCGNWIQMHQLK